MADTQNRHAQSQPKSSWSVVAIYQDERTRTRAVAICDQLVGRFWGQIEFQFHWFELDKLTVSAVKCAAATASAGADIIVCAINAEEHIPAHAAVWFDEFVGLRIKREGALVALVGKEDDSIERKAPRLRWLREIARRGGMDFLAETTPACPWAIPEPIQWVHQRADQISPILSDILNRPGGVVTPFD